jgi:hypothetical protein
MIDRMRFCPGCGLVTEHNDPTSDYCLRDQCIARRMGVAGARQPKPFVEVRTAKRKGRIKYARHKHAKRSRRTEPKYRVFEPVDAPTGPIVHSLLGARLDEKTLRKLLELQTDLEDKA